MVPRRCAGRTKIFSENGWCNCHDFFDIRIGVADGKAIVFKDINGNYNVAGNPVNVASRVMGLADRQQILITEEAYKNLIDMTEDTTLESRFISHGIMEVKHDIKLGVCQYVGSGENFLNSEIPFLVSVQTGMNAVKQQHPMFNNLSNLLEPGDPKNILQVIEHASEVMNIMSSLTGGSGDDMNQFMQLITKPEAVEKLREFVTTSNRLTELKKTLFIEGRGNATSL
jgi:hypothetical protein